MIVTLTDMGEPGSQEVDPDSVGFTLWDGHTLIFSTNWSGSATVEQDLDGGNLQIRTDKLNVAGEQSRTAQAGSTLSNAVLEPLVQEAIGIWAESGLDTQQLSLLDRVDVRTANLGGTTLGSTFGRAVWIDEDAAGYGWFTGNEMTDVRAGRVDLLSVVSHELGHVLDFEHSEDLGVMGPSLAPGTRTVSSGLGREHSPHKAYVIVGSLAADARSYDTPLSAWGKVESFDSSRSAALTESSGFHAPRIAGVTVAALNAEQLFSSIRAVVHDDETDRGSDKAASLKVLVLDSDNDDEEDQDDDLLNAVILKIL